MLTVRQTEFDAELHGFLLDTPSGSPGGIRVRDALPALEAIPEAVWFTARVDERLVGAYALLPRPWGWWRCHLTVTDEHADVAIPALVQAAAAHAPTNGSVIAGSCEDSHEALRACLEDVGYDQAAVLEVLVWSKKRANPDVGPMEPDELDQVQAGLAARKVAWPADLDPASCVVLRRNGAVCAGVFLRPMAWHLDSLGSGSQLTMPLLGLLGLELNPLRLCAFQGTFGETRDVDLLWRGALHRSGFPIALVGGDVEDPRWPTWTALSRGGVGMAVGIRTQRVWASGPVPRPLDWGTEFLR